jgi:hypothetical protein
MAPKRRLAPNAGNVSPKTWRRLVIILTARG